MAHIEFAFACVMANFKYVYGNSLFQLIFMQHVPPSNDPCSLPLLSPWVNNGYVTDLVALGRSASQLYLTLEFKGGPEWPRTLIEGRASGTCLHRIPSYYCCQSSRHTHSLNKSHSPCLFDSFATIFKQMQANLGKNAKCDSA